MTRKKDDKWPIPSGYARIEPTMPNSDDLIKISEDAHHLGFITIKDLACILASDNSYEEKILSACWNELQLNIRSKFPDDISTPEKRVSVWLSILERWTSKSIQGNRSGLKPILGLPGYKFIADEDKFIQDNDDPDYLRLDELKNYLIDNVKIFPLPTLLFPLEAEQLVSENKAFSENAFIHTGDAWKICFKGAELKPIKEMDGLTYIAYLLNNPGKSVHVTDLCASSSKRISAAMMTDEDVKESIINSRMCISTMQDDGLDDKAKTELKAKIRDLEETKADYDSPESDRQKAEQELKTLMKIISSQYGKNSLTGRAPKKVNEDIQKDLYRVRKAINRAYDKINKQSTELIKYLKINIKTGTNYLFSDGGTPWYISF